jgi:hypothetical protein
MKNNKKLEAELLKKEYVPPPSSAEKGSGSGKGKRDGLNKSVAERRAESKSWKLGGTVLTEEELLGKDKSSDRGLPIPYLSIPLSPLPHSPLLSPCDEQNQSHRRRERKEAIP